MYRQLCGHTGADPEAGIDEIQLLDMYKALGLRVDDDFETLCELGQGVMVVADREVAMALAAYQRIPVTPPPVPSPAWWPCLPVTPEKLGALAGPGRARGRGAATAGGGT